jgi:hypothetical protein
MTSVNEDVLKRGDYGGDEVEMEFQKGGSAREW